MTNENETTSTPDEARLACIREAVDKGFETQEDAAPWLTEGVQVLEEKGEITLEDLREIEERIRQY